MSKSRLTRRLDQTAREIAGYFITDDSPGTPTGGIVVINGVQYVVTTDMSSLEVAAAKAIQRMQTAQTKCRVESTLRGGL